MILEWFWAVILLIITFGITFNVPKIFNGDDLGVLVCYIFSILAYAGAFLLVQVQTFDLMHEWIIRALPQTGTRINAITADIFSFIVVGAIYLIMVCLGWCMHQKRKQLAKA